MRERRSGSQRQDGVVVLNGLWLDEFAQLSAELAFAFLSGWLDITVVCIMDMHCCHHRLLVAIVLSFS
jgi:hypothetical protein